MDVPRHRASIRMRLMNELPVLDHLAVLLIQLGI